MSEILDTCEEQYLSIKQLLRLVIREANNGSSYIEICDSGLNPNDLIPIDCSSPPVSALFRQVIWNDDLPCVSICSTDN